MENFFHDSYATFSITWSIKPLIFAENSSVETNFPSLINYTIINYEPRYIAVYIMIHYRPTLSIMIIYSSISVCSSFVSIRSKRWNDFSIKFRRIDIRVTFISYIFTIKGNTIKFISDNYLSYCTHNIDN